MNLTPHMTALIRCTQDVLPKSGRRRRNAIKASRTFAEQLLSCIIDGTELAAALIQ